MSRQNSWSDDKCMYVLDGVPKFSIELLVVQCRYIKSLKDKINL